MRNSKSIAGYHVLARIGEGAASELYAVQDPKNKQVWALKHVIKRTDKDQRFLEQVSQEYEVGVHLDHPNIRGVYRLIKHRKFFRVQAISLVMELFDAASLDNRRPKTVGEALKVFIQVARALAHMHSRGFVHADIKPNNILINDRSEVKIIDLGQACRIGTVKKRIQGTPGYMAPEQAHRQTVTERTDIYNLGATMYWVLMGEVIPTVLPPQDDNNSLYSGAVDANMVKLPVPPHERKPGIHPILSKQIMECIQLHPDDRPESMQAVLSRLELVADLLECPPVEPSSQVVGDDDTTFG